MTTKKEAHVVLKVIIETGVIDAQRRVFNVNWMMSDYYLTSVSAPITGAFETALERAGEVGSDLLREVMKLSGVSHAYLRPYELDVIIGQAFEWTDTLLDSVVEAVKSSYKGDEEKDFQVTKKPAQTENEPEAGG